MNTVSVLFLFFCLQSRIFSFSGVESDELLEERFKSLMEQLENLKKTNHHVAELLSEAETANGRLTTQVTLKTIYKELRILSLNTV